MTYWTLAVVVTLTSFAVVAAVGSLAVALVTPLALGAVAPLSPAARARVLFLLRVLPGAAAAMAAFAAALPIFLWFEADSANESIGPTLAASTACGAWLLWRGFSGVAAAWRATRAVTREWVRHGRRVDGLAARFPVYAVDERFPVVAMAGIRRPVIFVAECVLRECSPGEVRAMLAHEGAHARAWDNVKRAAIRACPALLGRHDDLERAWRRAAEEAADAAAAGENGGARLDLAEALVHVARLAQTTAPPLASAFYAGDGIEQRVRMLLQPPPPRMSPGWPLAAGVVLAVVAVAAPQVGPGDVHGLFERAIALLP